MANIMMGLFEDSKAAGEAVAELKDKGYTKEISVLVHNEKYLEPEMHEVKHNVAEGAATGAAAGAVTGALAAILSGIATVVVPGVGILVGGPLTALLGVTGGAIGSLTGGMVGALIDLGVNASTAQLYETGVKKGHVLVGVTTKDNAGEEVMNVFDKFGAMNIVSVNK